MLYSVVQTDNTISIHLFPNHIAANPKGYVKIPDVVEDIEKADLQESDHRYKICADILNMSENIFKKRKHCINIMTHNDINMSNVDVTLLCCSYICGQDVSRRMRPR